MTWTKSFRKAGSPFDMVEYKRDWNEAEIKIALAMKLIQNGLDYSSERVIPNSTRRRYDVGVHYRGDLVLLIECKTLAPAFKTHRLRSPRGITQSQAYVSSGLPWRYCVGIEERDDTITWVLEQILAIEGNRKIERSTVRSRLPAVLKPKESDLANPYWWDESWDKDLLRQ